MAKLYVDHMSQPSRTCMVFCRLNGLDVKEMLVNIAKGGTRAADYPNPLKKVPFLEEADGFGVPESAAILRYLCATRPGIAGHWYPSEPRARAAVDAVLSWHGSNLRIGSMITVWNLAINSFLGLEGNQQLVVEYGLPTLRSALATLDNVWLKSTPFVAGDAISVADLMLACEVEQLCLLDAAQGPLTMGKLLAPHSNVAAWLVKVQKACQPHYDEVHKLLRFARDRQLQLQHRGKL